MWFDLVLCYQLSKDSIALGNFWVTLWQSNAEDTPCEGPSRHASTVSGASGPMPAARTAKFAGSPCTVHGGKRAAQTELAKLVAQVESGQAVAFGTRSL